MDMVEKIVDVAKKKAVEKGVKMVKEEAIDKTKEILVTPAVESVKNSVVKQLNIDGAINELKEQFDVSLDLDKQIDVSELKNSFNPESITSEIDVNNLFTGIDFSELEAQGVDTTEIKKAISEAQSEIQNMKIDTSAIDSLDVKNLGLNFDTKTIFSGSTEDIKSKIKSAVSLIKSPESIEATKTIKEAVSTVKAQIPANSSRAISDVQSQVSSTVSQVKASFGSISSSFGGFRR